MSILVIGLLMSLLITAAVHVRRVAKRTADRQAIINLAQAVTKFKQDFGFAPPLVRDRDTSAGANRIVLPASGSIPARLNVYNPIASPADEITLRVPLMGNAANNPLQDTRYSTVTLAAYIVGAVPTPRGGGASVPATLPIDGVSGPGFYKPKRDGNFDIASGALTNGATDAARMGKTYEPMVSLGKTGLQLNLPSTPPAGFNGLAELTDSRNKVIRFYTWVQGDATGRVTDFSTMNIPAMVGRWIVTGENPDPRVGLAAFKLPEERDVAKNVKLRSAHWAVVGPGADGLFGDETDAEIAAVYGSAADQSGNRIKAETDNFVEVGE